MKRINQFFSRMGGKRIVLMCILSVLLVMVIAGAAFASEPTIADNIETAFGTAGSDLQEVVYKVGGIAMGVCVAVVAFRLAVSLFKRTAK